MANFRGQTARLRSPMRWNPSSIRRAATFTPDGEAVLRPIAAIGSPLAATPGLPGEASLGASGIDRIALRLHACANEDSSKKGAALAQPSAPNGVEEDMATLVLDKSSLGTAPAAWLDGRQNAAAGVERDSDAAVMLRAAAGDEAAFNLLAGKYHRPIIHFLFRMVRNQAIAEELAQEVFLRVYRSRASYRAEAKFSTWLYRIATNLAVNHARDTKNERAVQNVYLDSPDDETGTKPDVADSGLSAEQSLLRQERMKAIRAQVNALPERQRMAVLMHKYQGMDYREIGQVLKLSESAVKSLLFRAYQSLRETLKEFVCE
ncbi:MAG: sigma-70 family RNA polymerase sigma factor [Terracidiphilus sp.]